MCRKKIDGCKGGMRGGSEVGQWRGSGGSVAGQSGSLVVPSTTVLGDCSVYTDVFTVSHLVFE